jgi:DNA phosphorothioation-associated putative methyltransferase
VYKEYRELLDHLWARYLELGREPQPNELPSELTSGIQRQLGSVRRAMKVLWSIHDPEELEATRKCRINDLSVYFALNVFNGRTKYQTLPSELQRDIRAFFGSYKNA